MPDILKAWGELPGTRKEPPIPTDNKDTPENAPAEGTQEKEPNDGLSDDKSNDKSSDSSTQDTAWEDRYKELQRFTQRKQDEHKSEVNKLEDQLFEGKKAILPKTPEELAAFKDNNKEMYDTMITIVRQEAATTSGDFKKQLDAIKDMQRAIAVEGSFTELLKTHPDAKEIKVDPKFHEWYGRQTTHLQKMVNSDDTTVEDISFALDKYKRDEGIETVDVKKQKKKADKAKAAGLVDVDGKATTTTTDKKIWTESEISRMSDSEFAKHDKEISLAQKEGRLNRDMSAPGTFVPR